jgi:hypothetical protein
MPNLRSTAEMESTAIDGICPIQGKDSLSKVYVSHALTKRFSAKTVADTIALAVFIITILCLGVGYSRYKGYRSLIVSPKSNLNQCNYLIPLPCVCCRKDIVYYSGYHEQNREILHLKHTYPSTPSHGLCHFAVLGLWVCILALFAYFSRFLADLNCQHGFVIFTSIKYLDYLISCPILVLDLLWNLESPYRWYLYLPSGI